MKRVITILLATGISALATSQKLPRASSGASITQNIGLTEITVEYHRPNKKERVIWGDLVPYDKVWRTGANAATIVSFTTPITFGGVEVDSGSYSLFTIPGENSWKMILNSEAEQWGAYSYDSSKNVVEAEVNSLKNCETTETFTISFENCIGGKGLMVIKWGDVKVPVEIEVDLHGQVSNSIKEALKDTGVTDYEAYANAAIYYMRVNDQKNAKGMAMKSRKLKKDYWYSSYILATVAAENEDYGQAIEYMNQAIEFGVKASEAKGEEFRFKTNLIEMRDEWKDESTK